MCRVVTCTVPWELDGTCGTASRTDEATRNHDRPCLHNLPIGNIDELTWVPNGLRVRGWALDKDTPEPIEVHLYAGPSGFMSVRADERRNVVDVVIPYSGAGPVEVCAYEIDVGPGPNPKIACRRG